MMIRVLGSGQDAGIPHTGCYCENCTRARQYPESRRLGPSIALMDREKGFCYLIDASPDFKYQLDMIRVDISTIQREGKIPLSGILLTHAHFGHCAGLWHLGREALGEFELPVFCTEEMAGFLRNNHPFRLLVERENIKLGEYEPDRKLEFGDFTCTPFVVPHRNEVSDCVGYIIRAKKSEKGMLYLPDIDYWTEDVLERIGTLDIALVDGTFYSQDEIPRYEEVPHPPMMETVKLLEGGATKIYFTHVNHTNPVNHDGKERKYIEEHGFKIAFDSMNVEI
ncbi:MAG: MBL fold metallo-hydrolase [Thermoplasmata archaeon]|nr:MAG: MBL fold metallo-hydrolase [Thermoplasmata archaeon]